MRWIPIVLAVAVMGSGCGPTVAQQRSARVDALQLELESVLAAWKADAKAGHFGTSANAARALVARYDLVYERWGLRADPLTQALLAYASALATRVDRKALSADEANALLGALRADLDRARSALPDGGAAGAVDREAAMLACWKDFWAAKQQAFEATPRDPVRCEMRAPSGDGRAVACY